MEWNGIDSNRMKWNGMEWNGMKWNGIESLFIHVSFTQWRRRRG